MLNRNDYQKQLDQLESLNIRGIPQNEVETTVTASDRPGFAILSTTDSQLFRCLKKRQNFRALRLFYRVNHSSFKLYRAFFEAPTDMIPAIYQQSNP